MSRPACISAGLLSLSLGGLPLVAADDTVLVPVERAEILALEHRELGAADQPVSVAVRLLEGRQSGRELPLGRFALRLPGPLLSLLRRNAGLLSLLGRSSRLLSLLGRNTRLLSLLRRSTALLVGGRAPLLIRTRALLLPEGAGLLGVRLLLPERTRSRRTRLLRIAALACDRALLPIGPLLPGLTALL